MASLIEAVESLHRSAQAKLGISSALLGKSNFPAASGSKPPSLKSWATLLADQVMELREISAELAVTYYQLARWLETGRTLGAPLDGDGVTSGQDLIQSFLARVRAVEDLSGASVELGSELRSAMGDNPDHPLNRLSLQPMIEVVEGAETPEAAVRSDPFKLPTLRNDETVRKALITTLQNYSDFTADYARILEGAEDKAKALDDIASLMESKSSLSGGHADGLVMRAGRQVLDYAHQSDKRIRLYARGTSSNPCAFCAMLASRGFVYWTATSATKTYRDGGMNSYHDNCHCFPIVRWVETSQLPALNQYFQDNWEDVTGAYSGREKLNAWRRWLNSKRRESRSGDRTG